MAPKLACGDDALACGPIVYWKSRADGAVSGARPKGRSEIAGALWNLIERCAAPLERPEFDEVASISLEDSFGRGTGDRTFSGARPVLVK